MLPSPSMIHALRVKWAYNPSLTSFSCQDFTKHAIGGGSNLFYQAAFISAELSSSLLEISNAKAFAADSLALRNTVISRLSISCWTEPISSFVTLPYHLACGIWSLLGGGW